MSEITDKDLRKVLIEEAKILFEEEREKLLKRAHRKLREMKAHESKKKLS